MRREEGVHAAATLKEITDVKGPRIYETLSSRLRMFHPSRVGAGIMLRCHCQSPFTGRSWHQWHRSSPVLELEEHRAGSTEARSGRFRYLELSQNSDEPGLYSDATYSGNLRVRSAPQLASSCK